MPCFFPTKGYRAVQKGPSGKPMITFNPLKAINSHVPLSFPCNRCQGCRVDQSRQWGLRCAHEIQMHSENCFLTLTYDGGNLPADYSVQISIFQNFMKRLREQLAPKRIRFFGCGEYGELKGRPHYHVMIFGHRPDDLVLHAKNRGNTLYTSASISKAWPDGFITVGEATYQSAAYTARYALKKVSGLKAFDHYTRIHPDTGAVVTVQPEFMLSSRRPGLGKSWFDKFHADVFPCDHIIHDGKKHPVPRYYTQLLEQQQLLREIDRKRLHWKRKLNSAKRKEDNTPARLRVREEVFASRINRLKREL